MKTNICPKCNAIVQGSRLHLLLCRQGKNARLGTAEMLVGTEKLKHNSDPLLHGSESEINPFGCDFLNLLTTKISDNKRLIDRVVEMCV